MLTFLGFLSHGHCKSFIPLVHPGCPRMSRLLIIPLCLLFWRVDSWKCSRQTWLGCPYGREMHTFSGLCQTPVHLRQQRSRQKGLTGVDLLRGNQNSLTSLSKPLGFWMVLYHCGAHSKASNRCWTANACREGESKFVFVVFPFQGFRSPSWAGPGPPAILPQ